MSQSSAFGLWVLGMPALCGMCNRSIPNFKFRRELSLPWEPFRLQGLVLAEGIRPGPPPLARLKVLDSVVGEGARGAGRCGQGRRPRGRARIGEGSTCGFCSLAIPRGRPSAAWMGRRAAGPLCLAWPWRGPVGRTLAVSYLQALQRKTNDSLVSRASSFCSPSTMSLACQGTLLFPRMPVLWSCGCLACHLSFPKKNKEEGTDIRFCIFHPNGVCCK